LTGTGTKYLSVGSTTVTAGYYDTNDLATIDTDLVASNILDTATIFGITGTASAGGGGAELHSGQTTVYDSDGDDATNDGTAKSYTDNGDGTVTDNHTNLVWQKQDSGPDYSGTCDFGGNGCLTWATAIDYCEALAHGSGGLTDGSSAGDWRVPSNVELITLANYSYPSSSYIDGNFTKSSAWNDGMFGYWSSTTVPSSTSGAYYLLSYNGGIFYGDKALLLLRS
jgi:hypothetical protein